MAATSVKLDREMFGGSGLFPSRPVPRLQSPYVDDRLFQRRTIRRPCADRATSRRDRVPMARRPDRTTLQKQVARVSYTSSRTAFRPSNMQSAVATADRCANDRRGRCATATRLLLRPAPRALLRPAGGCTRRTGERRHLLASERTRQGEAHSGTSADEAFAELHYDFARGDVVGVSQTFTTSFPSNACIASRCRSASTTPGTRSGTSWKRMACVIGPRARSSRPIQLGRKHLPGTADRMISRPRFAPGHCCDRLGHLRHRA